MVLSFERQDQLNMIVKWEPFAPDVLQGLEPFAHLSEDLMAWTRDPRFLDPCKAICGQDELCLFTEKYNTKPKHDGGKYILHQDFPYWEPNNPVAAQVATAMLFLDDADRQNGTLEVAPASHTVGKHKRREDDIFHSLEMDESAFDMGRLIPVEVRAGSVVYFGAFLVHRSLPNTSDRDRRALLYSYQPAGNLHSKDLPRKRKWWLDNELRQRNGLPPLES
jgi:ectoine hydroxylase